MKTIKLFFIIISLILLMLQACEEEKYYPLNKGGEAPAQVLDANAEALPGAAKISYQLPSDKNLLYVKARATLKTGRIREVTASYYTTSLIMDGFGDTTEYKIDLYSVGRNNMESDPVSITVKPLLPPVYSIYKTIIESVRETFGGIKFHMENPSGTDVRIYVETKDSLDNWLPAETFYTSAITDNFSVRGYDTIARPFAIYVKDRWNNTSERYTEVFHPWEEAKLDKVKFRAVELGASLDITNPNRDMTNTIQQGRVITRLWDEGYADGTMYQTNSGVKALPHSFTIDLGVKTILSRILVHGRVSTNALYLYNGGMPKEWEIYGALNPDPNGSWDGWIPLRNEPCISYKPSGLPLGEVNNDDYQRQVDGEEFEFDATDVEVRYIRFKVKSVWAGGSTNFLNMTEITPFGSIKEVYN